VSRIKCVLISFHPVTDETKPFRSLRTAVMAMGLCAVPSAHGFAEKISACVLIKFLFCLPGLGFR
jgi:hypothetical protein